MIPPNHRRWLLVTASAVAHAGLVVLLALNAPQLRTQAPPDEVFEVTVLPRFVPREMVREDRQQAVQARPLAPRRRLRPDEPLPVAPFVTPNAPAPVATPGLADPRLTAPATQPNALRRSAVGCANPSLLGKAERDACLDRLGAGAKDAPFIEPPISRDKRRAFDEAAARKERMREYKAAPVPPGLAGSTAPGGMTGLGEGPRLRDFGK